MILEERIRLMVKLGEALSRNEEEPMASVIQRAYEKNKWFTPQFVKCALANICSEYLKEEKLIAWTKHYCMDDNISPKKIGIVMAGNIPLVGFHDFLCVFISGHTQLIKLSDKDDVLLPHIFSLINMWHHDFESTVATASMLKDCDAYIATGSNNSSRYFQYYFGKYPSVIRGNKTSVALLTGEESPDDFGKLSDDVFTYFGLGCRNVTKIFVPEGYDFIPLLEAFKKYAYLADFTKYKNNYDYNLALLIMNRQVYMSNENIILVESDKIFSPVSVLNFSFYENEQKTIDEYTKNDHIQAIVGKGFVPFGSSQRPGLFDYADGVDTMQFLLSL